MERTRQRRRLWPMASLLITGMALIWGLTWGLSRSQPQQDPSRQMDTQPDVTQPARQAPPAGIPELLLRLAEQNPETADLVNGWPGSDGGVIDISEDYTPGQIPHFLQWDLRWGYHPYGGDRVEDLMCLSGCGPTALSMVVVGMTGNLEAHPAAVADYAVEAGFATENDGTQWTLISRGAEHYGLSAWEVPLWEASMVQALQTSPIVCVVGPGDFTDKGHFIVLTAYEDGRFHLLDPNSRANSEKTWPYRELEDQILAMWSFEAER